MCTSEFITFESMQEQFATYNTELVGLSVDGLYSHIAWLRTIKGEINFRHMHDVEVTFPLVEDVSMAVVQKYGMIMPAEDSTKAVRAVFVIDPKCVVRAIIYYPLSLGRNFDELLRVIKALQAADHFELATPADWRPSEPVIVPPAGSCGTAAQRMSGQADGLHYENWLFCTTRRTAPASQRTYPPINLGDTVTDNERRHVANVRSSLWCSAGGIDLVGLGVHLRNGDVDTIERRTTPANNGPRTSSNMNRQPERLAGLPAGGRIRRMRMSAKSEYAVRAMIQLASVDSGALVKTDDLAKAQGIPPQFLVDILSDLRTDRLVRSHRGREGGYELAQPADEISIADVLRCIDGPLASVRDIDLGDLPYSGPTAALTDVWRALRASLRSVLEETSLADVAGGTLPEHVSMLADDYRAQEDRRGHGAQPAR